MILHPVTQGSEAWHVLRSGRPTASDFDQLVTPKWKVKTGEGPRTYLLTKLAECLTRWHPDVGSFAMEQGSLLEGEAIPFYEGTHDVKVQRVGFVTDDAMSFGCSPDGLIGEDGGIECKCPMPPKHLRYLLDGVLPEEYGPQVQGCMFVTGRPRWTFMSYCRKLPPLIVQVERDPVAQAAIGAALDGWLAQFRDAVKRINEMQPERLRGRAA